MKSIQKYGLIFIILCSLVGLSVLADETEVGPSNGSLVIVGGAMRDPAIVERFLELAGGPDAPVVVQGDEFEVIGQSYVVVYDNKRIIPPSGKFYFLTPGDRYNMKTREASRPVRETRPIDRVKKGEWKKNKS